MDENYLDNPVPPEYSIGGFDLPLLAVGLAL
jgi:hypothetical protein